jgi:hypothetical protein
MHHPLRKTYKVSQGLFNQAISRNNLIGFGLSPVWKPIRFRNAFSITQPPAKPYRF